MTRPLPAELRDKRCFFDSSEEQCRYLAQGTDTVLLGFSTGKDSLSAWLQCRRHFARIVPFYLEAFASLQFVRKSLAYYESFFNTRIHRFPAPAVFASIMGQPGYATPDVWRYFQRTKVARGLHVSHITGWLKRHYNAPDAFVADGAKMGDSLRRTLNMKTRGTIVWSQRKFYAVYDWGNDRLEEELRASGVKLPMDYRLFNRTFEAAKYAQLEPLRRLMPNAYKRMLRWVPLAGVEFARRQFYEAEGLEARYAAIRT